jgi:TatD DNase family protein
VYAERAVAAGSGCFFSVPPCVVRDAQMQRMVRRLPLERLLLETDSPALGAVAGGRNEPAELVRSLDMIAALKGVSVDECRRVIDESARRVFPLAFLGSDCDGTAGASPVYVNATGGSAAH